MATLDKPKAPNQMSSAPKPTPQQDAPKQRSVWSRLAARYRDVISEIRKVTWPTPEETRNLTIVVIGISAFVGILLAAVDGILTALVGLVSK